jgi:hypothetical protein
MKRFLLIILTITIHASFLHADEPSFKFTFGSNLGNIPLEINKMSKNIKPLPGIKINSWILSPKFTSLGGGKSFFKSQKEKESNEKQKIYIKFNFKF